MEQCASCLGYLLDGQTTLRTMMDAHGLDVAALREQVDDAIREYGCPNCERAMRTVIVNLDVLDLCFGCGTMFLDRLEAARVSGGLVGGTAATRRAPSKTGVR